MHNLALALQQKGYSVSGSDDEIFEPAHSRLAAAKLLPSSTGWASDRITTELDLVILGMHATEDNPEYQRALKLGLEVISFPAFIYQQSANKKRIVIGGSHGKTSITAMVMHTLKKMGKTLIIWWVRSWRVLTPWFGLVTLRM